MTFDEAIAIAALGTPVQRAAWPYTKTLVFSAGQGTTRAVAVIIDGPAMYVVRNSDLVRADYDANDWRIAA